MNDIDREYFVGMVRKLRRLTAKAEALACDYVPDDAAENGGAHALRQSFDVDLDALVSGHQRRRV